MLLGLTELGQARPSNAQDECDVTPLGPAVGTNGSMPGDLDGDYGVDVADYKILPIRFTGP